MPARPPLSAVFLDAGGTLLRERVPRAELYARAAREAGLRVDAGRMGSEMARAHDELPRWVDGHFRYSQGWFRAYIRRVLVDGLGLPRERLAGVQAALLERFADPATFELLPGALELVDALRARGLVVAVVSNWSEALPGLLEGLGLTARLDFALVSALEGCEKPDAELFRRALARARVPAGRALHAGDDPERDVQGARGAGILAALVAPPGREVAGTPRFDDLHGLRRHLLETLA